MRIWGFLLLFNGTVSLAMDDSLAALIPRALYAESHRQFDKRCFTVFKGAENEFSLLHSLTCCKEPCAIYFNEHNKPICTSFDTFTHGINERWFSNLSKRLTKCLDAHCIDIISLKDDLVLVSDAKGNVIAERSVHGTDGVYKLGDKLSENTFNELRNLVNNPDALKDMPIRRIASSGEDFWWQDNKYKVFTCMAVASVAIGYYVYRKCYSSEQAKKAKIE